MQQRSTTLLRIAIALIGLMVLGLCAFVLPEGLSEGGTTGFGPILWGMYATTIPFFIALFHGFKLLDYIDKNQAFSTASVVSLNVIKYCALIVGGAYVVGLPYFYYMAKQTDAPGVLLIGLVLAMAPLVIAVVVAVLQKLLQSAIAIKSENDLTV